MANSNKVFVSPGVYTSEKDLTFVAQSVGVTTLGLVGETLKGPAFEPILITNYDEFRNYFGYSSPAKDGDGNPKYQLPYVAKSYLQESNQLFVTRVLGLTGYKPVISLGITTLGGVTVDTSAITATATGVTMTPTAASITGSTYYDELSGKTAFDGTSVTDYIVENFSGYTTADDGKWFAIGLVDADDVALLTSTLEVVAPHTGGYNADANNSKEWYNIYYHETAGTIDAVYSYLFVYNSGTTTFDVTRYTYSATENSDYADQIVAELRPRGRYVSQTLTLEVTGSTAVSMTSSEVSTDALGDFTLTVSGLTGGIKTFTCSLDSTSTQYISKVLGTGVFSKVYSDFPVYVNEVYPNYLKEAFQKGYVRGLSTTLSSKSEGTNFVRDWDTPISPMVVSEVRGGKVDDLFEVITISDGEAANQEIKITIANIDVDTGEFDIIVRDFNDTDDNIVALEKFTRCSMNPDVTGYVAKKIGTSDTEYELRSKYIMLSMADNAPTDAYPAGFKGLTTNATHTTGELGSIIYKTQYYTAGDVTGYQADGTPIVSSGDKMRKVMLGMSSDLGFDKDLLKFKGADAATTTKGFHLSTNASTITGTTFDTTPYDLEGIDKGKLGDYRYRKFTFPVFGGFDGWDIYREVRTNSDEYIYGKNTYVSGNTTNGGVFDPDTGNSDYYAYITGIDTFANPEAIDINLFATPGINLYNHSSLVSYAIDMIEDDRADSLYVIDTRNVTTVDEVIDDVDFVGLDTNYSATYWPWIQIRDEDNATQLYIPPTGEVLRNFALTDNVAYPWYATAGYSRGLVNSIKAVKKLTLTERDDLYKNRVNPIATFSDTGTIIWGNKTLQIRESALDRVNVRRLLLRTRKLISAVAVRLLFEQNDEQVRNEFLRLVNPILDSIKKERGLYDFRVTVSSDPEDLDANTLRGKIYIKPTRALEFIDLEFIITPTGAAFENI